MVVNNMLAKSTHNLQPHGRKMFLYSGHENNVINVLAAMNLFQTHFPSYSSAVIIELHYLSDKDQYAVKVSKYMVQLSKKMIMATIIAIKYAYNQ